MEPTTTPYPVGTKFEKTGGDYNFKGEIVAVFSKKSGAVRYVGENEDGLLFIFNHASIIPLERPDRPINQERP